MTAPTSSTNSKGPVTRELGSLESFQAALYSLDFYCGTIITCRYGIPTSLKDATHSKLVETLHLAVADAVIQHPLLQVALSDAASKTPAWVQLDHIDLSHHIEWKAIENSENYDAALKKTLEYQVDTKFSNPETHPSWRVVILRSESQDVLDVMFVWHHSHTDGTGGKLFHQTLLQSLNKLKVGSSESQENHLVKTTATAQNLPPVQDRVAPYSISPRFLLSVVWKELIPWKLNSVLYSHTAWGPIQTTPCRTQLRRLNIDNATLQSILSTCRVHKTTLTGLLHGIAFISLAAQLPDKDLAAMVAETALNLRPLMENNPPAYPTLEPTKTIGNYVGRLEHKFDKNLVSKVRNLGRQGSNDPSDSGLQVAIEQEIWLASTGVREEIQTKMNACLKDDILGLMNKVSDWQAYIMKDQARKPRSTSWLVTNLGVIDGERLDEVDVGDTLQTWSIQRAEFCLSANVTGALFSISPMAAKSGDLCIDVSWQDGVVDSSVGDRLISDLEAWLRHVGSRE
ncbi:alcohol acetyltransferase-domain-containing protein [Dactylonectria estremocensis]|uniref:Alcohol acetyltransferase-domain-containing protein n=1 Tax=Dactylonectria estremocensis TaxID=1079267 RepID=A0A9P9J053_9HYPO|nr:alcohol acetyltransferase-domain-containing protein [Dactylonectria estremocensis]